VKGLALFWPFLTECLAFFSNFVGCFWPFFTEGLAFFEKINLATLDRTVAMNFIPGNFGLFWQSPVQPLVEP